MNEFTFRCRQFIPFARRDCCQGDWSVSVPTGLRRLAMLSNNIADSTKHARALSSSSSCWKFVQPDTLLLVVQKRTIPSSNFEANSAACVSYLLNLFAGSSSPNEWDVNAPPSSILSLTFPPFTPLFAELSPPAAVTNRVDRKNDTSCGFIVAFLGTYTKCSDASSIQWSRLPAWFYEDEEVR